MSCRAVVGMERDDRVATLLDLARDGDRATFAEVARCLGLGREVAEALWAWACRAHRPAPTGYRAGPDHPPVARWPAR